MSLRLTAGALLAACTVALAPAAIASSGPTTAQIRGAILRAEHSPRLWATVNICKRNALGVRGQMPTLGFPASLSMSIQIQYWAAAGKRFVAAPGITSSISLGTHARRLQQGGATFRFEPHAGLLRSQITFTWRRGGKLLGRATKMTTSGHHDADGGDPPGHSAATCTLT